MPGVIGDLAQAFGSLALLFVGGIVAISVSVFIGYFVVLAAGRLFVRTLLIVPDIPRRIAAKIARFQFERQAEMERLKEAQRQAAELAPSGANIDLTRVAHDEASAKRRLAALKD
ncbi:MAG TPA: hypothetical protein VHX44_09470 [Planctomycetota bacterium]|nr:hypothetical protein [Planctomycetota bacterium]